MKLKNRVQSRIKRTLWPLAEWVEMRGHVKLARKIRRLHNRIDLAWQKDVFDNSIERHQINKAVSYFKSRPD